MAGHGVAGRWAPCARAPSWLRGWHPGDPRDSDIAARLKPPGTPGHPLGTDQLGRDLLSRILHGTRLSLLTRVATVAITIVLGTWSGVVAGYYGGLVDASVSGVVDIQMAFPFLLMAVAIVSALGPGLVNVVVALALWGWVIYCRLVRARVLSLKEQEFVQAVRAMGAGDARIVGRHMLPNVVPALLVISSFQVAQMVVAESAMTFSGSASSPPRRRWGGSSATGERTCRRPGG